MPSPAAFAEAFGLVKGARIGDCFVTDVAVGHTVVTPFQRYEFPIRIELTAGAPTAVRAAARAWARPRNVWSQFGSPYDCYIPGARVTESRSGKIEIAATGVGVRNRDRRTQSQLVAPDPTSAAARDVLTRTHRLLKSRFATGSCATCGAAIAAGAEIARPKSAEGTRGGWSHVRCDAPLGASTSQPVGPKRNRRASSSAAPAPVSDVAAAGGGRGKRVKRARDSSA